MDKQVKIVMITMFKNEASVMKRMLESCYNIQKCVRQNIAIQLWYTKYYSTSIIMIFIAMVPG